MTRVAFVFALALGACGGRYPRPDNALENPAVVIAHVQKQSDALETLTGLLALEVWRDSERVRLRQLIVVARPDKLRVDTLSPFEQPLSMMASDGETVSIYSLEERRFWRGPSTPRNLARLVPLRLEGEELASVLRGGVPLIDHQQVAMDWDADVGCYAVTLTGVARRQRLCVEPEHLRVLESRVWRGDTLQYKARFGQYSDEEGGIPTRLRFEVPEDDLQVDVQVVDHKRNPTVAADAFIVEPPRGIEVETLE